MKVKYILPFILIMAVLVGCGQYTSPSENTELVGIALCGNANWPEYPVAQAVEGRLVDTGLYRVDFECAGEQADLQEGQLRIMLANHPKAIVITYVEGADMSEITMMIEAANVPLIVMDRDACTNNPDSETMRIVNEIMSSSN